jgi:hypothetical protein
MGIGGPQPQKRLSPLEVRVVRVAVADEVVSNERGICESGGVTLSRDLAEKCADVDAG